jgi:[ribosomal protein S5]-alanine N-acetyltransferase
MVWRRLFSRPHPTAAGDLVYIRPPHRNDFREWAALREQSRSFLVPWEPVWASDELTIAAFKARLRRAKDDAKSGSALVFFVFEIASNRLVGGITLGHIRHGVAMSAQIGYWVGEPFAGKGYMTDAVRTLARHSFTKLGLHRLEAACIPSNLRSVRVLEKAGFAQEGLLKSYLKINGQWQDHLLFARISGVTGDN